jgi:hypothetical protein
LGLAILGGLCSLAVCEIWILDWAVCRTFRRVLYGVVIHCWEMSFKFEVWTAWCYFLERSLGNFETDKEKGDLIS